MQDNEYIRTAYRPPSLSYISCFRSLLYMHNESVNIYSHGLGVLFFLYLAFWWGMGEGTWRDHIVVGAFLIGVTLCLGASALFHTLSCHSEKVSATWNRCDYVGIVFLIVGSCYPAIYYTFYCLAHYQLLYLASITLLGALCIHVCISDRFHGPKFRGMRAALFSAVGLSGTVPVGHALYEFGWSHTVEKLSLLWYLLMGVTYLLGASIYGLRIPERWFPGKFDYWFHSHQIFHICVLIAAAAHYIGVVQCFQWHTGKGREFCFVA